MKSFKHYIAESVHTYNYRIHVAGDIDDTKLELLKFNLQKFCPLKISEPKTTPIQKNTVGFKDVTNERVTIISMECRYPVIEPYVKQIAQLLGINENRVRLITSNYDDSITLEDEEYQNQMKNSPIVGTTNGEESTDASKKANQAYGNSYLDIIKKHLDDEFTGKDIPYSAKRTPDSFDPFKPQKDDDKLGNKSPMTNIKMPPKPKTGAMRNN